MSKYEADANRLVKDLEKKLGAEFAHKRELTGLSAKVAFCLAVAMSLWQIAVLAFYPVDPLSLRSIHLAFATALVFLYFKARPSDDSGRVGFFDWVAVLAGIAVSAYLVIYNDDLIMRSGYDPTTGDIIASTVCVLLILEITRRTTGLTLCILVLVSFAYGLWGNYCPELIWHTGYSYDRIASFIFSIDGIFNMPLGASSTYVFLFVLFGAFLNASGAGRTFTDIAMCSTGWARGGPAKIAFVASSLFGTISGSSVANVMLDGVMTIPMMIRAGYPRHLAAAVEAVASTGGQIMPPVMGAGAFIMAEMLSESYSNVIIGAFIPAVLYYFALYWTIDFEALHQKRKGVSRDKLPKAKVVLQEQGHLLIPLLILVFSLIIFGISPMRAAMMSMIAAVVCSYFRRSTRMTPAKVFQAFADGARGVLEVASSCACAGIVVGLLSLTGLGVKLSSVIVSLSGGMLSVALVLTMFICFILGMGLPTTAAYIIAGGTMGPALIKLGVQPLVAHMFIFYFACLGAITPPVCLSAFAAAGLAKTNMWKVGFTSMKIAAAGYLVPFAFVYCPELMMYGTWKEILPAVFTACTGAAALGAAMEGWLFKPLYVWQRAFLMVAAIALIYSGTLSDLVGFGLVATVILCVKAFKIFKYEPEPLPPQPDPDFC